MVRAEYYPPFKNVSEAVGEKKSTGNEYNNITARIKKEFKLCMDILSSNESDQAF